MKSKTETFARFAKDWPTYREALHKILTPVQVRLIYQRLANGKSFRELGVRYELNEHTARMQFEWSVKRIKEHVNREYGQLLEDCNAFLVVKSS